MYIYISTNSWLESHLLKQPPSKRRVRAPKLRFWVSVPGRRHHSIAFCQLSLFDASPPCSLCKPASWWHKLNNEAPLQYVDRFTSPNDKFADENRSGGFLVHSGCVVFGCCSPNWIIARCMLNSLRKKQKRFQTVECGTLCDFTTFYNLLSAKVSKVQST